MNNELELTLVNKINETYSESVHLAEKAKGNAMDAIRKAIECGQYLIEARTIIGKGNWTSWHSAHVRSIMSYDTADRYMKLAQTPFEELHDAYSLRQAYITAGILDKSSGKSDPINRDPDGTNWIGVVDKLTVRIEHLFDTRPVSQWEEDEREIFIERTRPVVKRFVEAGGRL